MPSFLTTSRMHPALKRRIEASVRGKTRGQGPRSGPSTTAALRALAVVVVGAVVWTVAQEVRNRSAQLEAARGALERRVERLHTSLGPKERQLWERVHPWLEAGAREAGADFVAPDLLEARSYQAWLERPALYVRGKVESFAEPSAARQAALESFPDAFAWCLLQPPPSRDEREIATHVGAVKSRALRGDPPLGALRPLQDALVALHYSMPDWLTSVRASERLDRVQQLERDWEQAKVEDKRAALAAELLIYLLDEPKKPGSVVELDGASEHWVRVGVVDLGSNRPLLRARRHLDPSWISETRRVRIASALDGCRLAFDLRAHPASAQAKQSEAK